LRLLDQRVAVDLPGERFGPAVHLLERLVDRHGADRHRRVADDPLARLVDVLPGREVHDRVGAPADGPGHLVTSSAMPEVTAELPMLALILVRKLRPMIIGSLSGWFTFAGMIARPRATSSRTNAGVISGGMAAPNDWPRCCRPISSAIFTPVGPAARNDSRYSFRRTFSRIAMYSISGVTTPRRA